MILEIKIRNFLSFRKEVSFSFEATSEKTLEDYYVVEVAPGVRILKLAMVYGANASGKSNFLKAIEFIRKFVQKIHKDKGESTGFTPFLFDDSNSKPGRLEIVFYIDGKRYRYYMVLDKNIIHEECLHFYPHTQPAIIFERKYENGVSNIEFGSKLKVAKIAKEEIQLKTLVNTSVFAAYSQVNYSIPLLDEVGVWFRTNLMATIDPYTSLTEYSDSHIRKNPKIKETAMAFLKEADFNIEDVYFEDKVQPVPEQVVQMLDSYPIPDEEKERIRKEKTLTISRTLFKHRIKIGDKEELREVPAENQSQGTMRYYGLSVPFHHAIERGTLLPIDEIGSALHPLLIFHFVESFLKKSKSAQLLFTTHNISILNEKEMLRKDAIWFAEKGIDGGTDMFSLSDFNFRKELSFYNAYKLGKFGAIPNLNL